MSTFFCSFEAFCAFPPLTSYDVERSTKEKQKAIYWQEVVEAGEDFGAKLDGVICLGYDRKSQQDTAAL
jgi:hypothetical protein